MQAPVNFAGAQIPEARPACKFVTLRAKRPVSAQRPARAPRPTPQRRHIPVTLARDPRRGSERRPRRPNAAIPSPRTASEVARGEATMNPQTGDARQAVLDLQQRWVDAELHADVDALD